jgi:hypothetical protein
LTLVGAFLVLLAGHRASAQTGGVTGTGTGGTVGSLSTSDFTLSLERYVGNNTWAQMDATTQKYFFNRARCECAADTKNWSGSFRR